jgi:uncharacterized protein YjeT (DUF2065 family)
MAHGGVVSETLRALLLPRRLIPIVLVCLPLLAAQGSLSEDPLAIPLGLATCVAFFGIAPVAWRRLFPEEREVSLGALRLVAYAAIGVAVVALLGVAVPRRLGMGATFLSSNAAIGVTVALFLAGGWGLGRDVGLEASLVGGLLAAARLRSLAEDQPELAELLELARVGPRDGAFVLEVGLPLALLEQRLAFCNDENERPWRRLLVRRPPSPRFCAGPAAGRPRPARCGSLRSRPSARPPW